MPTAYGDATNYSDLRDICSITRFFGEISVPIIGTLRSKQVIKDGSFPTPVRDSEFRTTPTEAQDDARRIRY